MLPTPLIRIKREMINLKSVISCFRLGLGVQHFVTNIVKKSKQWPTIFEKETPVGIQVDYSELDVKHRKIIDARIKFT